MFTWSRAACAIAIGAAAAAGPAHAQTVDEVIAKNLKARGGEEKLKALTTTKITGDVQQRGATIHIVTWAKRPNYLRREVEMTPAPPSPGRASVPPTTGPIKAVVAFDGQTVWTIDPSLGPGPQAITGPQADAVAKANPEFDSVLLDYKARGHTVELVGTETIAGKPAHHLKITGKNGAVQQYYLDVETGLEVRTSVTIEQGGVKTELTTDLSDYQTVDGFSVPFKMRQSVNGTAVADVTISKWEVNVPMGDELFKMPAGK